MFSYDNDTNDHGLSNSLIQPRSINGRMITFPENDQSLITIKSYLNVIETLNRLPMGPKREWIFHSGMLFGSHLKWWTQGVRATCHEGVDILLYRDRQGAIASVPYDLLVPALSGGTILNICDDFLGKSVIINFSKTCKRHRHNNVFRPGKTKSSKAVENLCQSALQRSQNKMSKKDDGTKAIIYSHILPAPSLAIGQSITKGQILGRIADTSMRKSGISAHLHLSFMTISKRTAPSRLNWQLFTDQNQEAIQFYDPMTMRLKYSSDGNLEVIL